MHSIRKLNDELNDDELSLDLIENDNGGRRTGIERRQFSYSVYIPERRSGKERRREQDRRNSKISE
jgi:hypothetical protein